MVTIHSITNVDGDSTKSYEFCGLSTDEKPTEVDGKPIEANSLFFELDTGSFYYFSEGEWQMISSGGGGGGGGDNKVGTAIVGTAKAG